MDLQELQEVKPTCHRALVVAALQQHSALGMQMLFADCERDVRNVVMRRLGAQAGSEDVVQETFLRASEHIDQLRDSRKLESWLCAIAKNESYKYLRISQRVFVGIPHFAASDSEEVSETEESHDIVERASCGLNSRDRLFLEMFVSRELSWQQNWRPAEYFTKQRIQTSPSCRGALGAVVCSIRARNDSSVFMRRAM